MSLARRVLTLAALLAFSFPTIAQETPTKPELTFQQKLGAATLAVYAGAQVCGYENKDTWFGPIKVWSCKFKRRFTCTATVVNRLSQDTYVGLSAGHCIDWDNEKNYFVSETVEAEPVLHNIEIKKAENDNRYDYVVFTFHSSRELPTIELNGANDLQPKLGTAVLNTNFGLGIGKEYLEGKVVSEALLESELEMRRRFLVSIGVGPGASGSPVVDAETHQIVGLVEAIFPGTQMATVVIPTGKNLADFMEDDSAGLKPTKEPVTVTPSVDQKKPSAMSRFLMAIASIISRLFGK
jgi:hypothetical protein